MKILKRNGNLESFNTQKIYNVIKKAFDSAQHSVTEKVLQDLVYEIDYWDGITVEDVQDQIEEVLMRFDFPTVAKSYILYREKHKETREIRDRLDFMDKYSTSDENAAQASETDANANVSAKNVVTLEAEVPKLKNRLIQRQRMKDKLNEMFPEVAKQYEKDIDSHIIYIHDEASSAVPKNYCEAVSLFPLLLDKGVGNIDGVTPSPANWLDSFCGQFKNLVFLLASQCKGAVAFGEFFNYFDYFCVKEFGENYHEKEDLMYTSEYVKHKLTIGGKIEAAFQGIVYYINQPAQNRGHQSPY